MTNINNGIEIVIFNANILALETIAENLKHNGIESHIVYADESFAVEISDLHSAVKIINSMGYETDEDTPEVDSTIEDEITELQEADDTIKSIPHAGEQFLVDCMEFSDKKYKILTTQWVDNPILCLYNTKRGETDVKLTLFPDGTSKIKLKQNIFRVGIGFDSSDFDISKLLKLAELAHSIALQWSAKNMAQDDG